MAFIKRKKYLHEVKEVSAAAYVNNSFPCHGLEFISLTNSI